MQRVRWGIVGAGNIAATFARDVVHAPSAELVAVAARNRADAEAFARRHEIRRFYGGYEALFADGDVDAVYIATPHTRHLPNARLALAAGKAVLCEKPLTVDVTGCRELLAAARRHDRYLMEAMWTWFLPAIDRARSWIEAGHIGDLMHLRADFGFRAAYDPHGRLFSPALAGGCLLDIGIYPIALARLVAGGEPHVVRATAGFAATGVEDDLTMMFEYPDFVAALAASFRCALPNSAAFIGTEARIEIPRFWSARECRLITGEGARERVADSYVDKRLGSGFEYQIEAVSADILAGRRQSAVVTHAASHGIQEDMARVRACFTLR